MLDFIEHSLKPPECSFIRRLSKDALELTPDDCTTKTLRVSVANTLENGVTKLLLTVFDEVEVTAMMCGIEILFDNFWVVCATVGCDDVDWFLGKNSGEKLTDGFPGAPVAESIVDRCTE